MRIVAVGPDDAARLVPLNAVVQALHAAERPDIFKWPTDPAAVAALFGDLLARPGHFALIAEGDDGDLGYAYCEVLDTPDDALTLARRRGVLHHIATVPVRAAAGCGDGTDRSSQGAVPCCGRAGMDDKLSQLQRGLGGADGEGGADSFDPAGGRAALGFGVSI